MADPTDLPPLERAKRLLTERLSQLGGRYSADAIAAQLLADLTAEGIHLVTEGQAVLGGRVEMEESEWAFEGTEDNPISLYRPKQHTDRRGGVMGEVVHACPPGDEAETPCCGRSPFGLPLDDRMTLEPELVTCQPDHPKGRTNHPCSCEDPWCPHTHDNDSPADSERKNDG